MSAKPVTRRLNPRLCGSDPIVLPEEQDNAHPEKYYKDIVWVKNNEPTDEQRAFLEKPQPPNQPFENFWKTPVELCRNCGWHSRWERNTGYASRVKVLHARRGMAIWSIGSKWLLRDQPNDCYLGNDYITQQFLRQQPGHSIPLVEEMHLLSKPGDKNHYLLMSRAQGSPLNKVWNGLSGEQQTRIVNQLKDALRQLRQFTAPGAQTVDGRPLIDGVFGPCPGASRDYSKVPPTMETWLDRADDTLRSGLLTSTKDSFVIEQWLQANKDKFPKCEPYVLSHCDLDFSNIIVNEDGIVAIIDWEHSGYFPWWMEPMMTLKKNGEFFGEIWQDLYPEIDFETSFKDIVSHLNEVREVYRDGTIRDHEGFYDGWYRRAWCECKPVTGIFTKASMGHKPETKLVHKPEEMENNNEINAGTDEGPKSMVE